MEKRKRQSFKRLYHLNTSRMLKILGYVPSSSDERKFLYSNYKQYMDKGGRSELSSPLQSNNRGLSTLRSPVASPRQHITKTMLTDLQDKVFQMGEHSLPRLQNTTILLKTELQQMVKKLKPVLEKM